MESRIKETIDSDGKSIFTVQRKWFGFWWKTMEGYFGEIEFSSYKKANEWVCYNRNEKVKTHEVDCTK